MVSVVLSLTYYQFTLDQMIGASSEEFSVTMHGLSEFISGSDNGLSVHYLYSVCTLSVIVAVHLI